MWLCGPFLPASFKEYTSKYKRITIKFVSNANVTRLGFVANITAIGTSRAGDTPLFEPEIMEDYNTESRDNLTYFYHDQNTNYEEYNHYD